MPLAPEDGTELLIHQEIMRWEFEGAPFRPPKDFIRRTDKTTEVIMYRNAQRRFQVEQIIINAGAIVPPHKHRLTAAIECAMSGIGQFTVNGVERYALKKPSEERYARTIYIDRLVEHYGRAITDFMYLSCQLWFGEEPMGFVTDDWDGPPL